MWFRKNRQKATLEPQPTLKPPPPESSPEPLVRRPVVGASPDWLDEIISEHRREGAFDNLPGAGRPLNLDGHFDMASHLLKNSHVLPPWLDLQREIRSDLLKLAAKDTVAPHEVEALNAKISRFNRSCPSPSMQRGLVSPENLQEQLRRWE